jgi:hypothetical protein
MNVKCYVIFFVKNIAGTVKPLPYIHIHTYKVILKFLRNFRNRLRNNQDTHSSKELSSTCKVGQKLEASHPLLTCSLRRDHPGYSTAEIGHPGWTYELPSIYISPVSRL